MVVCRGTGGYFITRTGENRVFTRYLKSCQTLDSFKAVPLERMSKLNA